MKQVEQEVVYTHNTGLLDTALHSLHWNGIGCDNGPDIQLYSQIVPLVLRRGGGVLGNLLTCARWHSAGTHRTQHTPHYRHTGGTSGILLLGHSPDTGLGQSLRNIGTLRPNSEVQ